MSILRSVERRLEDLVDGFLATAFRSGLHPVELAKRVAREMEAGKTVGVQEVLAPNAFAIALAPDDAERLAGAEQALAEELRGLVRGTAAERGWTLLGEPSVAFSTDPALHAGRFRCVASFVEGVRVPPPAPGRRASLEVEAGGGTRTVALGGEALTIGRLPDCDVVLDDPAASRHHARVERTSDGFLLEDLGSTNGTLLNGEPVERALLEDGDLVAIGATRLRFREA
ncbi:MAG: FhaA domain-containing protein [Actinomycetota bacterium]